MALRIASKVKTRRRLGAGRFLICPQVLQRIEPKILPQNTLSGLPQDIYCDIIRRLNVNDQICLALTSKSMAIAILNDIHLACNSDDQAVRFETWRFGWLPAYGQTLSSQRTLGLRDLELRMNTAKKINVKRLVRCKRKAQNDMMARLKVRQRTPFRVEVRTANKGRSRSPGFGSDSDWESEHSLNFALYDLGRLLRLTALGPLLRREGHGGLGRFYFERSVVRTLVVWH